MTKTRKNNFKLPMKKTLLRREAGAFVAIALLATSFAPLAYAGLDDANNKEVAIDWVNNYDSMNADPDCNFGGTIRNPNLVNTDDDSRGWYNTMGNNGYTKQFEHGDPPVAVLAKETDFEKSLVGGSDSFWVDNVDMTYFSGHGSDGTLEGDGKAKIWFGADNDGDTLHHCRVVNAEAQWGDKDVEWLTFSSSKTLNINVQSQWTLAFKDLHGITGFDDSPTDSANTGGFYACYLTGTSFGAKNCGFVHVIGDSWKQATIDDQTNVEAAVLRGLVTINGADRDYWTDFADNMWPDPPNGQYKLFLYTKWLT